MQTKLLIIAILFMMLGIVAFSGCVAVAVGAGAAGTVAYIRGDLEAVESADLNTVYEATVKAVEELDLAITKKAKDALSATIVTRDAQDKKITIKLATTAEETTKISIRVGLFGSETKSRLVYDQIKKNL